MATKLLLMEDVESLGRSGDVVTVRPGYARNFLLPKKLAVLADKYTLRMQARLQEERAKKAALDRQEAEEMAKKFEGVELTAIVKVDQEGHLYGSVSAHDILHLIQEKVGVSLEKRSVQLKHPIKKTGTFDISLKLKEGVMTQVKVKVITEAEAE